MIRNSNGDRKLVGMIEKKVVSNGKVVILCEDVREVECRGLVAEGEKTF